MPLKFLSKISFFKIILALSIGTMVFSGPQSPAQRKKEKADNLSYSVKYSTTKTVPETALTSIIHVISHVSFNRKFPAILNPASKSRVSPVHI